MYPSLFGVSSMLVSLIRLGSFLVDIRHFLTSLGDRKLEVVMKMRLSDIPFPFSFQNRQSFDTHDHSRLARQDKYNYNHDHYTRTYLLEADRITTRRPS